MPAHRVYLVGSDSFAWQGLLQSFATMADVSVAGYTESAEQALREIAPAAPELIVTGTSVGGEPSLALLTALRKRCPQSRLLVMADRLDRAQLLAHARLHVDGQLLWSPLNDAKLHRCLVALTEDGWVFGSREVAEEYYRALPSPEHRADLLARLTEREREVLELLDDGLTAQQIATRLGIQPTTVNDHIQSIYTKLGVRGHWRLAQLVATQGLTRRWRNAGSDP